MPGPQWPSKRPYRHVLAVLIGFAVVAAGCGGDAESTLEPGVTRLLFVDEAPSEVSDETYSASDIADVVTAALSLDLETGGLAGDIATAGLIECSEAPEVDPGTEARSSSSLDLDSELLTMLAAYGEERPRVFGGLWLDSEATGGLLMAVTDEVRPHLESIMADLDGEVWQAPFSLVNVPHSVAGLEEAARVISGRRFSFVQASAIDLERNRVSLDLFNPTADDLVALATAVDPNQVCITVAVSEVAVGLEFDVLPQAGGESLLTCDEASFPASALIDPIPLSASDHPAVAAMAPFLETDDGLGAPWVVLSAEPERAVFAKYGQEIEVTALATVNGGVWEVAGWTFGCDLRVGLPEGIGMVEIFTDPSRPFDQTAASIDVLVAELICTGGQTMGNRLLGPQVVETETEVILAFAAISRPVETFDCPTNPFQSVTITLDGPLAGRQVVDGTQLPPGPLQTP